MLRGLPALVGMLVLAGAGTWLWDLISDRSQLRADLAVARLKVATAQVAQQQALETARIHRAHLKRTADQARQWDALSNDLQELEGRNAPLSPVLRATAERLFGP